MLNGKLAISKSGHDKGRVYVIVGEDQRFVWLADGKIRTVDHPKKKNIRHIQPVTHLPEEVSALLGNAEPVSDLAVKRAIGIWKKTV